MGSKIFVVTDSTACISPETLAKYDNLLVVPLEAIFDDEVIDDGVLSDDEFYEKLANSKKPSTSAPSEGKFIEVFHKAAEAGARNIICVTLSSKLSATYTNAGYAATQLEKEGVWVYLHDSQFVSYGLAKQALIASEMANRGASVEEITKTLEDLVDRTHLVVALDTLEYLRRGGRIGRARRWLGALLKLKPILEVAQGEVQPLERAHGHRVAVKKLVNRAKTLGPLEDLAISHGLFPEGVQDFREEMKLQGLRPDNLLEVPMTSVIAVHGGPKMLGFVAIERSR